MDIDSISGTRITISDELNQRAERLAAICGISQNRLLSAAISLFEWAIHQAMAGRVLGAFSDTEKTFVLPVSEILETLTARFPRTETNHKHPWRSACCTGKTCNMCGEPADVKVGEEIFFDDPNPYRRTRSAYLCDEHFGQVMRLAGMGTNGTKGDQHGSGDRNDGNRSGPGENSSVNRLGWYPRHDR